MSDDTPQPRDQATRPETTQEEPTSDQPGGRAAAGEGSPLRPFVRQVQNRAFPRGRPPEGGDA
jgi:hypothetical protein